MKYIKEQNRDKISIFPISLDASIDQNNEVRISVDIILAPLFHQVFLKTYFLINTLF